VFPGRKFCALGGLPWRAACTEVSWWHCVHWVSTLPFRLTVLHASFAQVTGRTCGVLEWVFTLEKDTLGKETACFGVTLLPVPADGAY
jgi:hypothetical protein